MLFKMGKLIPRNRRFAAIGFILQVDSGSITMMQDSENIKKIAFNTEFQDVYQRIKRRFVVIDNVNFNGDDYEVVKQADIKVLKASSDTWWTLGANDFVNVCPRLSYPQKFHERWPYKSDLEARNIFHMVMNARRIFEDRTKFHQKTKYNGPAYSALDEFILVNKIQLERINLDKINSGNASESTPKKSAPPELINQKRKYQSLKRSLSMPSKHHKKETEEIIDLADTSDEESETEELTDADLQFLDDSEITTGPRPMNLNFDKEQRQEFKDQVVEMIGSLLNKEEFRFKSKILSANTFYKVLETARPVRSSTDLMMLIAGLPTNSVNMDFERLEALFSDLTKCDYHYCF